MADINWPATLPPVLIDGYSEQPPNNLTKTEMDIGPAKVRRRSIAASRRLTVTYVLTDDQTNDLDEFLMETTMGGALRFNWNHPRTGAAVEARFISDQLPSYSALGAAKYRASMGIEVFIL